MYNYLLLITNYRITVY